MTTQRLPTSEQAWILTNLAEMITESDVAKQCAKVASLLKEHFPVRGIALSLQRPGSSQSYLHTEDISEDTLELLQKNCPIFDQSKEARDEPMIFTSDERGLTFYDPQEYPQLSSEQIVLATPLSVKDISFGRLILVVDRKAVEDLTGGRLGPLWFTPLVSSILFNTIRHQQNAKRIRFLRLYQTVSSALGYVGDLQELLTVIVSIVTAELASEEGSVMLYDEEANEFEFFTAVGETGSELVKVRFPADKGVAGRALRERKALIVNDPQSSPDFYGNIDEEHNFKTESILAVPLISGDEAIGVVEAINRIGKAGFDEEDKRILKAIAEEVALAIKNARLFDYVVDSYCKIRQGQHSCKGCKRPLKSWTPCVRQLEIGS